jgi:hypothetical protein
MLVLKPMTILGKLVDKVWSTRLRDQGFDFPDLLAGRGVPDLVEIPGKLKIEPELCLHAEKLLKTKCRVRCNPLAFSE